MNTALNQNAIKPSSAPGSAKLIQPLFTDKFTAESAREKERKYEWYRHEGESLHELRVIAEVMSEVLQEDGSVFDSAYSQVTYTITFSTSVQAKIYAEKVYADSIKYPDVPLFEEHPDSLGYVWSMTLSRFHIVEICPTETEIAIASAYLDYLTDAAATIPWESDEEPTELGDYAA